MKKFLLCVSAAIVALASCSKTEVQSLNEPQEIGFKMVKQNMTKADPALEDIIGQEGKMGVYSYFTDDQVVTPGDFYFQNAAFGKNAQGTWSGGKYWPNTGELGFVVYAPHTATTTNPANPVVAGTDGNIVTLTQTGVAADADFLYGTTIPVGDKSTSTIKVTMKHAKAKVAFKAKSDAPNIYTINSVTLTNYNATGDVTVTYTNKATAATSADAVEWTNSSKTSKTLTPENGVKLTDKDTPVEIYNGTENNEMSNGILVLPGKQTQFTINYSMENTVCPEATFVLGSDTEWVAGKKYTYTINFSAKEITITPTVDDWTDGKLEEEFNHPEENIVFTAEGVGAKPTGNIGVVAYNGKKPYFTNVQIVKKEESWPSSYSWPILANGNEIITKPLSFLVYSPFYKTIVSPEPQSDERVTVSNNPTTIDIDNVPEVDDVLYGTTTQKVNGETGAPLADINPVLFKHAKAKVVIKITRPVDSKTYNLTNAVFENLILEGILNITTSTISWYEKTSKVENQAPVTDKVNQKNVDLGNGAVASMITKEILVIPFNYNVNLGPSMQLLKPKMTLTYTISDSSHNGNPVNPTGITYDEIQWQAGHVYEYTITLGENSATAVMKEAETFENYENNIFIN